MEMVSEYLKLQLEQGHVCWMCKRAELEGEISKLPCN